MGLIHADSYNHRVSVG